MPTRFEPWAVEFGGMRLGPHEELMVSDIDMGTIDVRAQDVDSPIGSEVMFGRDLLTAPTWTLTVRSMVDDKAAAVDAFRRLASVWNWPGRSQPGAYAALQYELAGEVFQVVGRPRSISPAIAGQIFSGGGSVQLVFRLATPIVFTAAAEQVDLLLWTGYSGGLVFPAEAPFIFGEPGPPRQGLIDNRSTVPVPMRVMFKGPVVNPRLESLSGGWRLELSTSLQWDRSVTIDTLAQTVSRDDGVSLASKLTYASDLNARLAPGPQEVVFSGLDDSGTARAVVSWRPGHLAF